MLDFSDTRFADFFASELKVNIDEPQYAVNGASKGKRLCYFLQNCDNATAVHAPCASQLAATANAALRMESISPVVPTQLHASRLC